MFCKINTAVVLLASLFVSSSFAAKCTNYFVDVPAKANNKVISAPGFDLTTVDGVTSLISSGLGVLGQGTGFLPVSGTYKMSLQYCPPAPTKKVPASRKKTVQLLFHGIPYNKNYWNGVDYPQGSKRYSWIDYATSEGYPVVAMDNLGSGNSTKANPITECQQNLETEIVHNVSKMLRAGQAKPAPKADKVIFVGHSIGAVLGSGVVQKYPKAFDAVVLTGWSHTVANAGPGAVIFGLTPASIHDPARYGNLPPAYVTFGLEFGKRQTYYGADGAYDPALAHYDFQHEGTTTLGELATLFSGLQIAHQYTGDVFVLTGKQDALFCGFGSRIPVPDCGNGASSIIARSKDFWPKSKSYGYYMPPLTSHALNLHYSMPESLKRTHAFLAKRGY